MQVVTVVSLLTSGAGGQRMENTSKPGPTGSLNLDATPETEEGTLTELNLWLRENICLPWWLKRDTKSVNTVRTSPDAVVML